MEIGKKTYNKRKKNKGLLSLCWVLKTCCTHTSWNGQLCLYHRGQTHFHLGWLPKCKTAAYAGCRRNSGVWGFFCSGFLPSCSQVPRGGHAEQGAGGMRSTASPGKSAALPNGSKKCPTVCSALTTLGEVQGGEVNIVRRGGASPGAQPPHASHRRGPGQLSPARMLGPRRHL